MNDVLTTQGKLGIICTASGIASGLSVLLLAYSVERFGGVMGGIIGTLPSTIVVTAVALFFLEAGDMIVETLNAVPMGMIPTLVLLILWRFLPSQMSRTLTSWKRLGVLLTLSIVLWFGLSYGSLELIEFIKSKDVGLKTEIIAAISICVYFVLSCLFVALPPLPVGRKGDEQVGWKSHLLRFVLGAVTTVAAILLSELNEYIGGLAITFPSVILTALTSLWVTHSDTVAVSAAAPMMVGSTSSSIYSLYFAWVIPHLEFYFGPIGGVITAALSSWFVCTFLFSLPCAILLRKKELSAMDQVPQIVLYDSDEQNLQTSIQ